MSESKAGSSPAPIGALLPWHRWALVALLGVFVIQLLAESRLTSPTSDEPPHIASGLSYVSTGVFRGNPEHPPLVKELSALGLLVGGIRWPQNGLTDSLLHGSRTRGAPVEWEIGNRIIADNGPDHALFWARLPVILIAAMMGIVLFLWSRHIVGATAAVCAVFVLSTDPTILGHSFLVTTDMALGAFTLVLLLALWRYVHDPTLGRLALSGLALGAVLCAKFSAVLLLPVVGMLVVAAILWPPAESDQRQRTKLDPFWRDPAAARGRPVKRNDLCWCGSGKKVKACHGIAGQPASSNRGLFSRLGAGAAAFAIMCVIAVVVIQAVYFFSKDPLLYVQGMRLVNANHRPDGLSYFGGQFGRRFTGYFVFATLLKQPIAGIVLATIGLVTLVRRKMTSRLGAAFLLLAPVVLFVGPELLADQLGVRYVLPSFPFAHVLAGLALAWLFASTRRYARGLALALALWLVAADAGSFPNHLSYFNESACLLTQPRHIGVDGGSRCGPEWLDDSNVDWGGGLRQLKTWVDARSETRPIRLLSIYGFPPSAYGLQAARPPQAQVQQELVGEPVPGLYAISASLVARVRAIPGATNWPGQREPLAIIGNSLYLYRVP